MSTVVILAPVVIASWPAIIAAVNGAAAALGFAARQAIKEKAESSQQQQEPETVEVQIADSEVSGQMKAGQKIVLTKGDIQITVGRDQRGRCTVCAEGKGMTKAQLEQVATEFAQKMTQCFIYNKVMQELKARNFNVISEEVMADQAIRIYVRQFVE